LLFKYIKSVLWTVAKRLSYIEDARCLKVKCREVIQFPVASDRFMANIEIEGEGNEVEVHRDMH